MKGGDHKRQSPVTTRRRVQPATVIVLKCAKKEGREFLNVGQYEHTIDIVQRLAFLNDIEHITDMSIQPIEDFYELREKGGLLGRINLRVFFGYFSDANEVVVVRTYKKEEEDQTPRHVILNVQSRLRMYRRGELREDMTTYTTGTTSADETGQPPRGGDSITGKGVR